MFKKILLLFVLLLCLVGKARAAFSYVTETYNFSEKTETNFTYNGTTTLDSGTTVYYATDVFLNGRFVFQRHSSTSNSFFIRQNGDYSGLFCASDQNGGLYTFGILNLKPEDKVTITMQSGKEFSGGHIITNAYNMLRNTSANENNKELTFVSGTEYTINRAGVLEIKLAHYETIEKIEIKTVQTVSPTITETSITFGSEGRLSSKTFATTTPSGASNPYFTLEVGNASSDNEVPFVNATGAYVIDANGYTHAFYGNGKPSMGSYYTIKPTTDGQFNVYVKGEGAAQDNDGSLVLIDASGNYKKIIPYSEYKNDVTKISCGYLLKNKIYYLYSRSWVTLYLQKVEFTSIVNHLSYEVGTMNWSGYNIVVENDFDQYSGREGEPLWEKNATTQCVASSEGGGVHGVYAKSNTSSETENRSMLYPLAELESRDRYTIEFDAKISVGSTDDSQIAIYRKKPANDKEASDYILSIKTGYNSSGSTEYKFYVPGKEQPILTASLDQDKWYHYFIQVRHESNNSTIGVKVTSDSDHSTAIAQTEDTSGKFARVSFTGSHIPLGISYLAGKENNVGRFDNILVTSNQGAMGSVTAPTIEVTGISGKDRTITVTAGVPEQQSREVTTYYEYTTKTLSGKQGYVPVIDESGYTVIDDDGEIVTEYGDIPYNWDYILSEYNENGDDSFINWSNFTTSNKEFTIQGYTEKTVVYIRAISTIKEYATVLSDTAYLAVIVGDNYQLTGGFAVQEMKKVDNEAYYTPKVRAYIDTKFLNNANNDINKVNVKLYYKPIDYASNVDKENVDFVYLKGTNESGVFISSSESGFTNGGDIAYYDFEVPRSGHYILHISGTGFLPGTIDKIYYKNKYKITYQTPDFSVEQPLTEFENTNVAFNAVNKNILNRIYGYTGWSKWTMADIPYQLEGWSNNDNAIDYYWNTYTKGTTATLNSVSPAKSGGSTQTYNIRTTQYDTSNPLIIRKGWGIVKNVNTPWSYSCALAHIGMGNEIPEFTIDDGKGGTHNPYKVYPTPFITGKNTPECIVTVPSRAALVQYKVYTPVETKTVSATSGLASFSSYYSLYHVADYFIENDELVGSYFAPNHYSFGSNYLLNMCWYMKEREGYLLAANIYNEMDIWEGYDNYKKDNNRWTEDKTIELRIIDATPDYAWRDKSQNAFNNRIKPVLLDNEVQLLKKAEDGNDQDDFIYIYASDIVENNVANANGQAQMVLLKGKRNNKECYNFFCLPKVTSKAKMVNKTSYILREDRYSDYLRSQQTSTVKEEGERFIFGMIDDGEVVGIDLVEDNANVMNYDNGVFYNIAGQKVSTPTKGIYIVNGKKVLVK